MAARVGLVLLRVHHRLQIIVNGGRLRLLLIHLRRFLGGEGLSITSSGRVLLLRLLLLLLRILLTDGGGIVI